MLKRRNIRALVLIKPIGFFYENGKPMGIMYDALSVLQTFVNEKFKTGALKIEISFIPVRPDQAWAVRKNNPQLKQLLDKFISPRALGSSFGNTLECWYLEDTRWVVNSTSPQEMKKFEALSGLFKKYAGQYSFET